MQVLRQIFRAGKALTFSGFFTIISAERHLHLDIKLSTIATRQESKVTQTTSKSLGASTW